MRPKNIEIRQRILDKDAAGYITPGEIARLLGETPERIRPFATAMAKEGLLVKCFTPSGFVSYRLADERF